MPQFSQGVARARPEGSEGAGLHDAARDGRQAVALRARRRCPVTCAFCLPGGPESTGRGEDQAAGEVQLRSDRGARQDDRAQGRSRPASSTASPTLSTPTNASSPDSRGCCSPRRCLPAGRRRCSTRSARRSTAAAWSTSATSHSEKQRPTVQLCDAARRAHRVRGASSPLAVRVAGDRSARLPFFRIAAARSRSAAVPRAGSARLL